MSSLDRHGRAASCTRIQSSLFTRPSSILSALSTVAERLGPPANIASILSGKALQSCSPQWRSSAERITKTLTMRGTEASVSTE